MPIESLSDIFSSYFLADNRIHHAKPLAEMDTAFNTAIASSLLMCINGNLHDAESELRELLIQHPKKIAALYALSKVLIALGKVEEAYNLLLHSTSIADVQELTRYYAV